MRGSRQESLLARMIRRVRRAAPRERATADPLHVRSVYGPLLIDRAQDATFRMCVKGTYGWLIPDVLNGMQEPFVFIDIGANIGVFSLVAAANPRCEMVVAVEPVPATYSYLVRNIELNQATQVVPFCAALTSLPVSVVRLSFDALHSGASRVVEGREDSVLVLAIPAQPLTELIGSSRATVVMKIDVEGHELSVLQELRKTAFYGRVRDVIVEVAPRLSDRSDLEALHRLLGDDGFVEVARSDPRAAHYDAHYHRAPRVAGN